MTREELRQQVQMHERLLQEWLDKTEWVQHDKNTDNYLGMHRADVMTDMINKLRVENADLKEWLKIFMNTSHFQSQFLIKLFSEE